MNYLAHLFLAENSAESRLGNFLGDFVKGSLEKYQAYYSPEIIRGIRTHRQIDYFTDTHWIYQRSKRRLSNNQRRFSGIIIDIYYDHFLANHWQLFSEQRLTDFIADIYILLESKKAILPDRLKQILPIMMAENWLGTYQLIEGVELTFTRLSRRLKRVNSLATATDDLLNHYADLESDFLSFFPEVIIYSRQQSEKNEYSGILASPMVNAHIEPK